MKSNISIIEDMKSLGLSEYEIKAYLKLLEQYPVNGYTLSKESGIPRSRIYEVLDSLKNKQMVFEQSDNKLILIKGRKSIIDFLNLLISDVKKRVALSIWEEEINDISEALKSAISRGGVVKGICFGKNNSFKELVTHRRIERYLSEKKNTKISWITQEKITLVIQKKNLIILNKILLL